MPCLTINCNDFSHDLIVELKTISQILLTFQVNIFVSLPAPPFDCQLQVIDGVQTNYVFRHVGRVDLNKIKSCSASTITRFGVSKLWLKEQSSAIFQFSLLLAKMPSLRFHQEMGFTRIFEKKVVKKNSENWTEKEFTYFGESGITSIFAKERDSLGFLKKKK